MFTILIMRLFLNNVYIIIKSMYTFDIVINDMILKLISIWFLFTKDINIYDIIKYPCFLLTEVK